MTTPNPLVIDAFKPVIDAAREFAHVDDAHRDGMHYHGGPNPDEHERKVMLRAQAERLADYVEGQLDLEPGMPEHMRPLFAMTEIVASVSLLNRVLDVLRERCNGG